MSKYQGRSILLYIDGQEVACQKDLSLNIDRNLFPTNSKQDNGWETHGNGRKKSSVVFSALQSTVGLSGTELMDLIRGANSSLLVINGFAYPYVMEVDLQNSVIDAPDDNAVTLSGTFVANGKIYRLAGGNANLVTDPDGGTANYDTLTVSGISITSAIDATGSVACLSNAFSVTENDVVKMFVFVTLTSGQLPTVGIWDNVSAFISNTQVLGAGLNVVTFTVTGTVANATLKISNTAATNFATSNIYCFKAN